MRRIEVLFTSEDKILSRIEYEFDSSERADFFKRTITDPDADSETMRKAFTVLSTLEESQEEVDIEFGSREYYKVTAHVMTQSQKNFYFQEFLLDSREAAEAFTRGAELSSIVPYLNSYISGIEDNIKRVSPVLSVEEDDTRLKGHNDVDKEISKIAFLRGAEAVREWSKFEGSSAFMGASLEQPEPVVLSETTEFIIGGITLESEELFVW